MRKNGMKFNDFFTLVFICKKITYNFLKDRKKRMMQYLNEQKKYIKEK